MKNLFPFLFSKRHKIFSFNQCRNEGCIIFSTKKRLLIFPRMPACIWLMCHELQNPTDSCWCLHRLAVLWVMECSGWQGNTAITQTITVSANYRTCPGRKWAPEEWLYSWRSILNMHTRNVRERIVNVYFRLQLKIQSKWKREDCSCLQPAGQLHNPSKRPNSSRKHTGIVLTRCQEFFCVSRRNPSEMKLGSLPHPTPFIGAATILTSVWWLSIA